MTSVPSAVPVVVPLASGRGPWPHVELRYSLRSLEEHGRGVSGVVIVGRDVPGWASPHLGVIRHPAFQLRTSFERVRAKLAWLTEDPDWPAWWVLWNDDFYATEPWDARVPRPPAQWSLGGRIRKHGHRGVHAGFPRMLRATSRWVRSRGVDPDQEPDYLVHRPVLIRTDLWREALREAPADVSPRAVYGRLAREAGLEPVLAGDSKMNRPPLVGEAGPVPSGGFWSSGDGWARPSGVEWLERAYPKRSRWERNAKRCEGEGSKVMPGGETRNARNETLTRAAKLRGSKRETPETRR